MTAQVPVHPDDVEQLLKIRRYLIGFRITNGWTQKDLSRRIGDAEGTVYDLEASQTWQWRLAKLQAWTVPFGLRLKAYLRFDDELYWVEEAVHDHLEVSPAFTLSLTGSAWPKWQLIYLTSALSVARKELGLSGGEMASRLGQTRKAVTNWEAAPDNVMLPKLLHYARALGGFIELGLDERLEQK